LSVPPDSNPVDPIPVQGTVIDSRTRPVAGPKDIEHLETLVRLLDEAIRIPGTNWRFGLDSVFGLLPGAGDLAGAILAAYVLKESSRLGASRRTLARMVGNIALDFAVGAVPLLGDVFDVAFKANRRNLRLLKKHLKRLE
jgi:hypothetical protein